MSSVSLSLVSSFIFSICFCVFVFFLGDSVRSMLSGVLSRLSLLSTIPSTCGIILTFPSAIVWLIFPISSPKLIYLRFSGNSDVWSVCLTATLTCCAPGRLFLSHVFHSLISCHLINIIQIICVC